MCTHKTFITNKYTGKRLLVNCGRCPACLQERANDLTNRIRSHVNLNQRLMFLTLTYDRISCPYIRPDELINLSAGDSINIYREYRITHSRTKSNKRVYGQTLLDSVEYDGYGLNTDLITGFKNPYSLLKHRPYVGVCYYKDFQNFIKRLRINLNRHYGITDKIDFFGCSEFGPKTKRPHFHAALFVPIRLDVEKVLRPAILESWPYASKHRTSRGLEYPRRDISAYVASYVNCTTSISAFLRGNFPPKRSFSKYFGLVNAPFCLSSVLDAFESGDFTYYRTSSCLSSAPVLACLPPRVIARYFPKIKGYNRFSDTSILHSILHYPRLLFLKEKLGYRDDSEQDDFTQLYVTLTRGFRNFCAERDFSDDTPHILKWADYMFYYERIWSRYYSFKHKWLHYNYDLNNIPVFERYDNINQVFLGTIGDDGLIDACYNVANPVLDPNAFPSVVKRSEILERYFWLRDKQKKVSNVILDSQGFDI